jgi:hypothetical protein
MAVSLFDLTVPTYLQILGAAEGFLAKGAAHCAEKKIDPNEIVETRLFPDMLPFRFQVVAMAHHSAGALRGAKTGQSAPPANIPPHDYAALQKLVRETREAVQQTKPEDVNSCEGKDVVFKVRDITLPFVAEGFLLSFALPNFYFHATTAYDILRMKGVPLGKRDFMGKMRLKS